MLENRKINFAIVGLGHIGKRHAEMILRYKETNLVAFCDIQPKETLDLENFNNIAFYSSIESMLSNQKDIDIVCICSPNGLHTTQALLALEHSKHVVIEKPMSLTKSDGEKILFKSLQMSKKVFCVMQNRYSPPSVWLKDLVDKQILGKIFLVQVNCYWNRDERYYKKEGWKGIKAIDGGTLFTQFSHFIDILYWLFGDISDIIGGFYNFNHQSLIEFEDTGIIQFKFKEGGIGCINYSTSIWDKNFESSITIIAENGTVKVGGQYMNEVEYCHIKNYEMPDLEATNSSNDYGNYKGSAANHHFVFENIIDHLNNSSPITTNVLEGLKVVEIIENIYKKNPYFN